ncbi:MAG: RNA polymerase sigma factor, partial [Bacilli bacterium]
IRKYYNDIYRFCFRKTANSTIAADLTQEVFLRLAKYIHNYVHKEKFKNYLFIIAKNTCMDYFKKNGAIIENIDLFDVVDSRNGFIKVDQSDFVMNALNHLPHFQKEVIILRFYHDMKVKDIAQITETSVATTKSRLKQGLDKLEKIIQKEDVY